MLVKFMARGVGGGAGPVDYLLGRDRQREGATVLRGDPEQIRELIDSVNFSRNYTSAVLSFEESEIDDQLRQQCMDEFEQVLMPGLERNQYSAVWIEHSDKGRVELNVLIPNVELQSGKRLQPYYDRADRSRVDAWKTAINAEHELADPSDPARKRALSTAADLPRDRKELAEAITRGLLAQARVGQVSCRADVLEALQCIGLEVVRETKTSISIKPPDGGHNIRLKGGMYERDFEISQGLRSAIEAASANYTRERKNRAINARRRLNGMLEHRAKENRTRYKRPQQAHDQYSSPELVNDYHHTSSHSIDSIRGDVVAIKNDFSEQTRDQPPNGSNSGAKVEGWGNSVEQMWRPEASLYQNRFSRNELRKQRSVSVENTTRLLADDRIRATAIERIRKFAESTRESTQRFCDSLQQFSKNVQHHIERERDITYGSERIERANQQLERANQQIETLRNFIKKVQQYQHSSNLDILPALKDRDSYT